MPFQKSFDGPDPTSIPACIHLRSKSMYVTGQVNPDDPNEPGANNCWCNRTQHVIGPDSKLVDRVACTEGRECYHASL
jgi:hypothetical protein